MDLKHLRAFMLVAQQGSITAAAPLLFLSPPALAQQINHLEQEAGTALFKRSPRGVSLTPAGQAFLEGARNILDLSEAVLDRTREAAQGQAGPVRIGSVAGLVPDFFPRINAACHRRLPHLRLIHVEDTAPKLLSGLSEGSLDLMEYYDAPQARRPALKYIPLVREGRFCLMSAHHPLAGLPLLRPEDLEGERLYAFQYERVPGLKQYLGRHYPAIRLEEGVQQGNSYYTVLELCSQGGLCLIPPHCADFFAPLLARPLALPMTWTAGLICRKNPSPQVARLIDLAKAAFAVGMGNTEKL